MREHGSANAVLVRRLLRSEPFARSRRKAEQIDGDIDAVSELAELVRLRHVEEDPHLAKVATAVEQALTWLTDPNVTSDQGPSVTARRRMALAALCYLYDPDDVIPDDRRGGTYDDYVVLESVLTRALGNLSR